MKVTREQIIELINQYVYANGRQLISGEQLNEILNIIASSFAMEGEASSGIDEVLQRGNTVADGREINNNHGGKFKLSAEEVVVDLLDYIMSLEVADAENKGLVQVSKGMSAIGSIKTVLESDPADRTMLNNLTEEMFLQGSGEDSRAMAEDPQSFSTASLYVSSQGGKGPFTIGAHTLYIDENTQSLTSVSNRGIIGSVSHIQEKVSYSSNQKLGINNYSLSIQAGDEDSRMNQNSNTLSLSFSLRNTEESFQIESGINGQRWIDQSGEIASIGSNGLKLEAGKKIELTQGGKFQTAGLATLSKGSVIVNTGAVNKGSVISLTVQSEGAYAGNIRVTKIESGTSFSIVSSDKADSCVVFWQIIELH